MSDIDISPYEIQYTYGNSYLNGEYAARQIVRDNVLHSTVSTIGFPIFTYKDNGNVATVKYTYHPAWTEDFIKRVIAGYDEAISLINLDDTDFAKALKLHDWIVKNVSYGMSKTYSDFAVGALANRSAVCAGYAQCYQFLLSQVGVQSIYIAANTTKEPHAWNLVKIDGHYFHVDCTWDRGLGVNPNVNHTYFMLNDEEFNRLVNPTVTPELTFFQKVWNVITSYWYFVVIPVVVISIFYLVVIFIYKKKGSKE